MATLFSEQEITTTTQTILAKHGLVIELEMSRSGTYQVLQTMDNAGTRYMLKVLRKQVAIYTQQLQIEAAMLKYISGLGDTLRGPAQVFDYTALVPPGLLYERIEGRSLGWYYFYVDSEAYLSTIGAGHLLQAIDHVQNATQVLASSVSFPVLTSQMLLDDMRNYKVNALAAGLPEEVFTSCITIVEQQCAHWLENRVLAHADFNPKNIVLTPDNGLAFIDWSDTMLASRYYDSALFWLVCWRQPNFQSALLAQLQPTKEFWQTVCFWLPKFYSLLHDTKNALEQEYTNNEIPPEAKSDNLAYIAQAKQYYSERLTEIIRQAE